VDQEVGDSNSPGGTSTFNDLAHSSDQNLPRKSDWEEYGKIPLRVALTVEPCRRAARWRAVVSPVRLTRQLSLPATARHSSTGCGTITGVSLTPCDRNSADIVDHPRPADDRRSAEVGYFFAPCVDSCGRDIARGNEADGRCYFEDTLKRAQARARTKPLHPRYRKPATSLTRSFTMPAWRLPARADRELGLSIGTPVEIVS
jgi:hypothetical protein